MSFPCPMELVRRLVRYHLADYVRGETSSWPSEAIRDAAMTLTVTEKTPEWMDLRLSGSAQLFSEGSWYEGACRERGLDTSLLGYLRFDRRTEQFVKIRCCGGGIEMGWHGLQRTAGRFGASADRNCDDNCWTGGEGPHSAACVSESRWSGVVF